MTQRILGLKAEKKKGARVRELGRRRTCETMALKKDFSVHKAKRGTVKLKTNVDLRSRIFNKALTNTSNLVQTPELYRI